MVTSEMLLGSGKNGRLEVARSFVSTTSGTVSVIITLTVPEVRDLKFWSDALSLTTRLTAPGSLNTYPTCKEHYFGTRNYKFSD